MILLDPQSGFAIRSKFASGFLPTDGKAGLRMTGIMLSDDFGNFAEVEELARQTRNHGGPCVPAAWSGPSTNEL